MKSKKIGNKIFLRIDKGEEIVEFLAEFCSENKITVGEVRSIALAAIQDRI